MLKNASDVSSSVGGVGDAGSVVGILGGKAGGFLGDVAFNFSSYITNMGFLEWFLLVIIGGGGFIVWYLKNKYDLKFSLFPKRPKKTFN